MTEADIWLPGRSNEIKTHAAEPGDALIRFHQCGSCVFRWECLERYKNNREKRKSKGNNLGLQS